MSTIYRDSELQENEKYVVQDIKQLRDAKRYIGKTVQFVYPKASTAHVRWTNNMHTLPIRALIKVPGYIANPINFENADAFAVVCQNDIPLPVGRVYIGPTSVTETHVIFTIDGKDVSIPRNILASMAKIKEKPTKEVKKVIKATGVSKEMVDVLDKPEHREDIDAIPSIVLKIFPELNIEEIKDQLSKEEDFYGDYEGNPHLTQEEADRANAVIRHKRLSAKITKLIEAKVTKEFQTKRTEAVQKRSSKK